MKILYSAGIVLYTAVVYLVSPFRGKARLWVSGRSGWVKNLRTMLAGSERKLIWFHCASLGEFEQGRPVMELIREKYPEYEILLTFFSPSGYEIRKNWPVADYVVYLPADTPGNAEKFIDITRPSKVFFVKYEFWYNYLTEIHRRKIPLYLISGIFRAQQSFFRKYGGFFRNLLRKFTHIYVQDENSSDLLNRIGIENSSVAGDTRFDRVNKIASSAVSLPVVESFCNGEQVVVAGSTWHRDEEILAEYIKRYPGNYKWVIAPHEISSSEIERLESWLKVRSVRYSGTQDLISDARVLIIDNIGILSSVYRYASVAVIGGGFGKGIHNILEAACWGLPVLFGPNHKRFREANQMLEKKAAFCFSDYYEFRDILDNLMNDKKACMHASDAASEYVTSGTGATEKIVSETFQT